MIACPQRVTGTGLKDQQVFGVAGYCQLFSRSVETLRSMLADKGDGAELVWDKVRTEGWDIAESTLPHWNKIFWWR